MPICEIINCLFGWGVISAIGFWLISIFKIKFNRERVFFYSGIIFMMLGFLTSVLLTAYFNKYLSCSISNCEVSKIQAQSLIGLFLISWASIGANLIAAFLTEKK